jgi:hypothetical protein
MHHPKTVRLPIPDDACAKARELLTGALALPDDILEFCRGDVVCLRGTVRAFASQCVVERDRGIIRHERWTPIERRNRRPRKRD